MPLSANLPAVREILQTDRPWAVYALADLAPEYSAAAEWHIATQNRPALLLVYRGFRVSLLFAHGAAADIAPLLAEVAHEPELHLSVRAEVAGLLLGCGYRIRDERRMMRMVLDPRDWTPLPHIAERLGPEDYGALSGLFADGDAAGERPPFFDAGMLRHGVYYGIREGNELAAAAGTHVLAIDEEVAAIGNVYTRRDRRGRGFAPQVTAAVAGELLSLGIRNIALNVEQENAPAVKIYERLGFKRYCEYREGVAIGGTAQPTDKLLPSEVLR